MRGGRGVGDGLIRWKGWEGKRVEMCLEDVGVGRISGGMKALQNVR
jgi:hypothetical protein